MLITIEPGFIITIPEEITKKLNLSDGDLLDIYEENGCIRIDPCKGWSKEYEDELRAGLNKVADDLLSE